MPSLGSPKHVSSVLFRHQCRYAAGRNPIHHQKGSTSFHQARVSRPGQHRLNDYAMADSAPLSFYMRLGCVNHGQCPVRIDYRRILIGPHMFIVNFGPGRYKFKGCDDVSQVEQIHCKLVFKRCLIKPKLFSKGRNLIRNHMDFYVLVHPVILKRTHMSYGLLLIDRFKDIYV